LSITLSRGEDCGHGDSEAVVAFEEHSV